MRLIELIKEIKDDELFMDEIKFAFGMGLIAFVVCLMLGAIVGYTLAQFS